MLPLNELNHYKPLTKIKTIKQLKDIVDKLFKVDPDAPIEIVFDQKAMDKITDRIIIEERSQALENRKEDYTFAFTIEAEIDYRDAIFLLYLDNCRNMDIFSGDDLYEI